MGIRIIGTGSALPKKIVTNQDLEKIVETSDEWIKERTGIGQRHVAEEETVASLGAEAGKNALDMAGWDPLSIDLILVATCSADHQVPSASCQVQAILGCENAMAIDIGAACTGFLTALTIANSYLEVGAFKRAIVIGSEVLSSMVDWTDRGTCILFGDGAGAVCVEKGDKELIYKLGADGSKGEVLTCERNGKIKMNGQEVYRFATRQVPECIEDVLGMARIDAKSVDHFVLHQANRRILESISRSLRADFGKFGVNLDRTGNMSSASIPVLLDVMNRNGELSKGETIVMAGFGAGLTYGAAILTWE